MNKTSTLLGKIISFFVRVHGLEGVQNTPQRDERHPPPKGSIPGDPFSIAASAKVGVHRFASSDDAMKRELWIHFIVRRRQAAASRLGARNSRTSSHVTTARRHLLALFGEARVECTGHGACDYGAGDVTAPRDTLALRVSTHAVLRIARIVDATLTGTCECEENYVSDQFEGQVTPAVSGVDDGEDAAMDKRVDATGRRVSPRISAACWVRLWARRLSPNTAPSKRAYGEKGDCYEISAVRVRVGSGSSSCGILLLVILGCDRPWYMRTVPKCGAHNISQIHLYVEEPCRSIYGSRFFEC